MVQSNTDFSAVSVTARGKTGATATPVTQAGGTASVAPTTGAHVKGEYVFSDNGKLWYCTVAGTPGTWVQIGNGASASLTATGVKTANYTAGVGEYIPVDTTSGAVTITLPTTPAASSQIVIEHVAGTAVCLVVCGGTNKFDTSSGPVADTLSLGNSLSLIFETGVGFWYRISPLVTNRQLSTTVGVPASGQTKLFAQTTTGRFSAKNDDGVDALVDYRRIRGRELRHWKAALANRYSVPANCMFIGDSVCEGAGATTWQNTWNDIVRDGLQREYKSGGEGFIPPHTSTGFIYPNRATLAGTPNETDFGGGWGRRSVLLSTVAQSITYTSFCDRFYVVYTSSATSGTFKVVVDGVTLGTQSAASTFSWPGRVYDSGVLPLGTHTITIVPNAASNLMFIEGIMLFNTDVLSGVHVWNGGHGGTRAEHYNGDSTEDATAVGCRRNWPAHVFQPYSVTTSGAGSVSSAGGTTLTWTGGAFDSGDIGEVVFFGSDVVSTVPRGIRIVSVTDATHIVVNKVIPSGTYTMAFTRSRVTDASRTSGLTTVTSATMAFNSWDAGKTITGTGFLQGSTIRRVISPTQVEIYPGAFSTGTGGTLQILNRQAKPMRPDLFNVLIGGNDMFLGITKTQFKADLENIVQTLHDIGNIDNPTMTGISTDERPSVCLINVWGTNLVLDVNLALSTTSGSPVVSANTTGQLKNPRFSPADIGKNLSGAPVNGLTINAVAADGQSATLSGNASSTTTNSAVILLSRAWQDSQFVEFRQVMSELSADNDWMNMDLYNLATNVGTYDNLGLMSYDNIHPNDRGHQWIADEYAASIGGVKKLSTIPAGIFDNTGEMIKGRSVDSPMKVPGILIKSTADVASSAVVGTYTDIADFAFNLPPNETLSFQFYLIFTAAAATSGLVFRLNGAAGMSTPADLIMAAVAPATAATFTYVGVTAPQAWPQAALTGTGSAAAVPAIMQVYGSITAGAVGGLVTPQFSPEVAFAVTLQRGSFAVVL